VSAGAICRRCVYWDAQNQMAGLAARCAFWTAFVRRERCMSGAIDFPAPESAVCITTGFDTCPQFTLAEHDEAGRRIPPA
jgi:hypothetical protein